MGRISQTTELAAGGFADGDWICVVDVSDVTQSADGTTKKSTRENFLELKSAEKIKNATDNNLFIQVYEDGGANNGIYFNTAAGKQWRLSDGVFRHDGYATSPGFNAQAAAGVPVVLPNKTDTDTGVVYLAADQWGLDSGGSTTATLTSTGIGLTSVGAPTSALQLPQENDAVTPTLSIGDGDTGIYESADDTLAFARNGGMVMELNSYMTFNTLTFNGVRSGSTNRFGLVNGSDASSVNPTLQPRNGDANTGIGAAGNDQLSLIAGGTEGARVTTTGIGVTTIGAPTSALQLPQENDAVTPTLSIGDGDTGFYESADDVLEVSVGGIARFQFTNTKFQASAAANGYAMMNENASSTNPTLVPNKAQASTGIGAVTDECSIIVFGVEALTCVKTASGVNFLKVTPAVTTAAPQLAAEGSDANIDLALSGKGSGVLQFGTHAAIGAETVTGYITINDSGGTPRKLAVVS
jgi:hypothetical protein